MEAWKVLNILCSLGLIGSHLTSVKAEDEKLKKCLVECTRSQMIALKAGQIICGELEDKNGPVAACHAQCFGDKFTPAKDQNGCHCDYCKNHPNGPGSYCNGIRSGGVTKQECDSTVCKGKVKYRGPFCVKKRT